MKTRFTIACCACFVALLAAAPCAHAQKADWPTRPVRFIVPFPPGGSVDPLARLVGARLTAALGQQFIVDNRPGASGTLGTALAAKANPDGYTFVFVFDSHAVNPALYPGLPFDTALMAAHLMFSGTLDALPGLNVVLAHGGGHLTYQIGRLAHVHKVRKEGNAHTANSPLEPSGKSSDVWP